MKKKIIYISFPIITIACIAFALFSFTKKPNEFVTLEERVRAVYDFKVTGMANEHQFAYDEMLSAADIAVIARSADGLSEKNSVVREAYNEADGTAYVQRYFSVRQAEILTDIKNETADNKLISVDQECAKLSPDKYVAYDGCYPMIKGDVYALFMLKNKELDAVYVPLCTDNGLLNLSYLKLNRRVDLAAMTAVDMFETDFPQELKEAYLKSKHPGNLLPEETLIPVFEDNVYPWHSVEVTTPYTEEGMEITVEYTEADGILYFRSEGFPGYYDPNE